VVILFTDGRTEDINDYSGSYARREQAIQAAVNNGIKVFGVFLNHNGSITDNQEVFDIVRQVRSFADDPVVPRQADGTLNNLGRQYSEILNANDIIWSFSDLVHLLTDGNETPQAESVPISKTCLIPGIGVSELNISIRYRSGVLGKITITIELPDLSILGNESTDGIIITKTDVFFNVKIINPMPGEWKVTVDKASDEFLAEEIEVVTDIIISTDIVAVLDVPTPDGGAVLNKPITFTTWLEQDGLPVQDSTRYSYFDCTLVMVDSVTKEVHELAMQTRGGGGVHS
jgi:hypothetical protein